MMQHLHLKPLRDREERENRAAEKAAVWKLFIVFYLYIK